MDIRQKIGERLKQLRKAIHMTQQEVANKLFVTQPNYVRFEQGVYELSYEQIRTLCVLFQTTSDYLLCRSDENEFYD